jgi:hypothetical protein
LPFQLKLAEIGPSCKARLALFFLLLHQIVAFDAELVLSRRLKLRNKMLIG